METKEDKIMIKFELISQNYRFWTYIKKNQQNQFMAHGHSSWSTFGLHPLRGPKAL